MVTTMESYLMMLYVTLEQESALKNFFVDQGWAFCKPDLSVTTDRVGPIGRKPHVIKKDVHAIRTHPQIEQTVPTIKIALAESKAVTKDIPKPSGKRKAISKRLSIKSPKQAKIMSSASVQPSGENVELQQTHNVDNKVEEPSAVSRQVTLQMGDGQEIQVKIERETEDTSDGEVVGGQIDDVQEEDDGDDDFETTGIDFEDNAGGTSVQAGDVSAADRSIDQTELPEDGATPKIPGNDVTCTECFKVFSCKGTLRKHKLRHGEKKMICSICDKGFYRADELRQHIIYIHDESAPCDYMCEVCGKPYKSKSALHNHLTYKHGESAPKEGEECTICGKMLSNKRKRLLHERTHKEGFKGMRCTFCNKIYNDVEEHIEECTNSSEVMKHACLLCGSVFLEEKYLNEHVKYKHGKGKFMCPVCNITFSKQQEFLDHKDTCSATEVYYLDQS